MTLSEIFNESIQEATALLSLYDSRSARRAVSKHAAPEVFLRAALVFAMAAIDKILHEAISKHFAGLAKDGSLDQFVQLDVSKAYQIALDAREGGGEEGEKKRRPGHDIKTEVLTQIYTDSYLSTGRLEQVCAACGKKKIFALLAKHRGDDQKTQHYRSRWSQIYLRRNQIAHECDIQRKEKMQKVSFNPVDPRSISQDIRFIRNVGRFLAKELE